MKSTILLLFSLHLFFIGFGQLEVLPVDPDFESYTMDELISELDSTGGVWLPFLKGNNVLTGIYKLKSGQIDRQQPHDTDEVYYVVQGKGRFTAGDQSLSIAAGSILFVKANVQHQFYDITEDITLLVFFDQ